MVRTEFIFINCEAGWRPALFTSTPDFTDISPGEDRWKLEDRLGEQEKARCDGDPAPPEGSTSIQLRPTLPDGVLEGMHPTHRSPPGTRHLAGCQAWGSGGSETGWGTGDPKSLLLRGSPSPGGDKMST